MTNACAVPHYPLDLRTEHQQREAQHVAIVRAANGNGNEHATGKKAAVERNGKMYYSESFLGRAHWTSRFGTRMPLPDPAGLLDGVTGEDFDAAGQRQAFWNSIGLIVCRRHLGGLLKFYQGGTTGG